MLFFGLVFVLFYLKLRDLFEFRDILIILFYKVIDITDKISVHCV